MSARPRPSDAERRAASARIRDHVLASPEYARARRLALYAALPDEAELRELFEQARRDDKPCLLPRCDPGGTLAFCEIEVWEDLAPGRYGLLEPSPDRPGTPLSAGDLVLVPGVAFDPAGRRLGRGRAYYDRALAGGRASVRMGVGFAIQLVERVPAGARDCGMDAVVTEDGVVRPERGRSG